MKILRILTTLLITITLVGCGSNNIKKESSDNIEANKNISISIKEKNIELNPAKVITNLDRNIVAQLFDTLTYINAAKNDVSPLACSEFNHNDDFTKWSFELRNDLKFSDGSTITAKDFVKTITDIIKDTNNPNSHRLYFIKGARDIIYNKDSNLGIKAKGNIVEIECENPNIDVAKILAQPCFSVTKNNSSNGNIITSGAYKIASYEKDKKLVLNRNENYWDNANTRIDSITFTKKDDFNLAYNLVQQDIDTLIGEPFYSIPREFIDQIKNSPNKLAFKNNDIYMLLLNQKDRLADVNLRRAFMYGMDRHSLITLYNSEIEDMLTSMYVDNEFKDYDTTNAKKFLKKSELDIKSTKDKPFILLTDNNPHHLDLAEFIVGNWHRLLGIDFKIRIVNENKLEDALRDGKYDFCLYKYSANTDNPEDTFNFTYKNEFIDISRDYNDKLEKAMKAKTEQDKLDLYKNVDKLNVNDVNFIPIYRASNLISIKSNIKFFNINNIGITYLRDIT